MALAKEVGWIILDHLSILMSGNESHDERKLIDVTMTKLRSFVEETGIGMLLISHLKRPQGDKGHEDGQQVSLGQLRGSHSIVQLSDMVIALERNLSAGDNMANIRVLKNRFNGQTGQAGTIAFNGSTGRMTEDLTTAFKPTTNNNDADYECGF
jgi:twinkle protein